MKLLFFYLIILSLGCTQSATPTSYQYVKLYLRSGYKYFGYSFNNKGDAIGETGKCSTFDKPFVVESVENKVEFKTDSIAPFSSRLQPLKENPMINKNIIGDWRVEIFFEGKLVYDGPMLGNSFWRIILPIATQLPPGMNPLVTGNVSN